MKQGQPSKTAEWVARLRAAHQLLDAPPHVLEDPVSLRILSAEQRAKISSDADSGDLLVARSLRAFVVGRSRYTEDLLARAVSQGVRQYVVLGAGLDTFAYRNPFTDVRVFEVDHPATQAWKRERLAAAAIPIPPSVTFAPVDFNSQSLAEGLAAAGFQPSQATFFAWLGVTPYIPLESFRRTLAFISAQPLGSGVVFDYTILRQDLDGEQRRLLDEVMARVATMGEPLQLFFHPGSMGPELTGAGFTDVEDLDKPALHDRYFAHRADGLSPRETLGQLASAWVRKS